MQLKVKNSNSLVEWDFATEVQYLMRGDNKAIAAKIGVTSTAITEVVKGRNKTPRIQKAIIDFIAENKRKEQKQKRESVHKKYEQIIRVLVVGNYQGLKAMACCLTRNERDAEDILHDYVCQILTDTTMVNKFIQGGVSGDINNHFRAYSFKVLKFIFLNQLQAKKKVFFTDEIFDSQLTDTYSNGGESSIALSKIERELEKAPVLVKQVIQALMSGETQKDIYKALGMPKKMVTDYWNATGVPFQEKLRRSLDLESNQYPTYLFS